MSRVSDERARWLAQLVLPHEAALRAWLARGHHGGLDPDDVVQEAFAVLAGLDSVEHIRNPRTYFFSVAHSIVLTHVRRAQIVRFDAMVELETLDVLIDDEPSPERAAADRQELRRVAALIRTLPQKCRQAFMLRKIDGLTQREISQRMGVSEGTVEKHITKALRLLVAQSGRERMAGAPRRMRGQAARKSGRNDE